MRRFAMALLVAVGAVGVTVFPAPRPPQPDLVVSGSPPPVAICPVEQGSGLSTLVGVVSTVNGTGRFTVFAAGESVGSLSFQTGASASFSIDVNDVSAVGSAGALLELPSSESAAASIVRGGSSLAAESCQATPVTEAVLAGASTLSGEEFTVQLLNPYTGRAVVGLTAYSESGLESAGVLDAIVVPPQSSFVVDLAEILPGRERLSLTLETIEGRVIAIGRMTASADSAIWKAVPPAQQWLLPVTQGADSRDLIIATPSGSDVEYEIDVWGPEGLVEGLISGVVPALGEVRLPVTDLGEQIDAVRVVGAGPLAVFFRSSYDGGLSITSGSQVAATRWLAPGAGFLAGPSDEEPARVSFLLILNPSEEDAEIVVTERRQESTALRLPIESDTVLRLDLSGVPADGVVVDSTTPVVVMWVAGFSGAQAMSSAIPFSDE